MTAELGMAELQTGPAPTAPEAENSSSPGCVYVEGRSVSLGGVCVNDVRKLLGWTMCYRAALTSGRCQPVIGPLSPQGWQRCIYDL